MVFSAFRKAALLSLPFLIAGAVDAEARDCSQILKHGIWEHSGYANSEQQVSSFLNWYNRNTSTVESSSQNLNGNAAVVVEGIPIELGFNASEANSRNFVEKLQTLNTGQSNYSSDVIAFTKKASEAIVGAWKSCMANDGFHVSLKYTYDPREFWIVFRLSRASSSTPDVKLTGLNLPGNVSCDAPPSFVQENEVAVRCTRNDTRAASIGINSDTTPSFGSTIFVLDKISQPPKEPKLPTFKLRVFDVTGQTAQHPSASISLPPGYKLIAGGARDNWKDPGNMLWALYPKDTKTWVANGKDHTHVSHANVTIWALGLHDPNNEWEVRIFQNTSGSAQHPGASVSVPADYLMTGGGARMNWAVHGSLLTASYPSNESTWTGLGKDHSHAEFTTVTVYAIGIKPRNGARLPDTFIFQSTGGSAQHPTASVSVKDGYIALGGGAKINWSGPGSLLTASYPSNRTSWTSKGKDHTHAVVSTATAYLIGMKR